MPHDLDFGELVFRRRLPSAGVVLMRFETPLQDERLALFRSFWPAILESAEGHFIVTTEHSIRIRPLPSSES